MQLKQIIKSIKTDPDYNLRDCQVDYVKENNLIYLIVFKTNNNYPGRQLVYKFDKKTNKYEMIYLPNEDNFKLLKLFNDLPNIY